MKVAIVGGAGGIGSSVAFNLLLLDGAYDVVLVDRRDEMVLSHVMDLEQTVALGCDRSVRGGDGADVLDADVVVISASVPLRLNDSRMTFLADNVAVLQDVAGALAGAGPDWGGVVVMVTNPVDPLCTWLHRRTGLDRRRIAGYTLNDSLRLRTGIARALGVAPTAVDAWVLAEHGDGCVPVFSRVAVNGAPTALTPEQRADAEEFLRSWYARHVALDSGRTSTWTSGLGIARMVHAIAHGSDAPWPASVVLDGEYDVAGVALSVPVSLGPGGVRQIHEWKLSDGEHASLRRAAAAVREAAASVG